MPVNLLRLLRCLYLRSSPGWTLHFQFEEFIISLFLLHIKEFFLLQLLDDVVDSVGSLLRVLLFHLAFFVV